MGGGVKRKYRVIDFKRDKFDIKAEVIRLEYDPNRSAFISLLKYDDGEFRYIIAPQKIKVAKYHGSFRDVSKILISIVVRLKKVGVTK